MPTDSDTRTVVVAAPFETVLATIRDVESQPTWIPEILDAELLEVYEDDGLPATARFKASATVGTDEYTLSYEHTDDTMSWTMLEGRMQTGQEGCYTLREVAPGETEVTYELTTITLSYTFYPLAPDKVSAGRAASAPDTVN